MVDLTLASAANGMGVAVITGAASGLGLAAAKAWAAEGLDVWMVDVSDALPEAAAKVRVAAPGRTVTTHLADVSDADAMRNLAAVVSEHYRHITVLMNNAGVGGGGDAMADRTAWDRVLGVNFLGVLNGVQAFAPLMIPQTTPSIIINTGSKQGITTPPGDTAYNVSKAAVKVLTEGLAHTLRNIPGCRVRTALFVPGYVFTGMTRRGAIEKPIGAWTPEQTIDHLLARLRDGSFYVICPDGETTSEMDRRRIAWAAGDITENRPPLSRWHDDHKAAFADYMKGADGG